MRQLVERLARGETAAFAELYDCCANQLHHYLVGRLGSREAADDVLQETFLRLARSARRFGSVENPVAYAFAVARNEALRKRQRHGNERRLLAAADLFEIAGHDERQSGENAEVVAQALNRISDEQREVIELKIYGCLTFREIAEATGVAQGTVATRYRAAINRLRSLLAKEWS
ncbi:MAG TPA: RNA polymerase sigma factor [Pirellulales bacterium]|jgi:RNA polymerase sigma-70 factor (ECF subfamily)|nr:RNA polymerase sigma factor [Pirellulales bacterium]